MAKPVFTTAQLTALIQQLERRLVRAEKLIRNHVVDDDSGSFGSLVTSLSGGKGSVSASWSGERERSFGLTQRTTGTGSDSVSLPEQEGLPGA